MTALRERQLERPARRSTGRLVGGLLIVAVGVAWLAERVGLVDMDAGLVLPLLVVAVGLALLASWRDETHGGLIGLGVVLTVLSLVSALAVPFGPIGDRRFEPLTASDVADHYEMTAGSLELDLSRLEVSETTRVSARVGFGEIDVVVPAGVSVVVEGHAFVGRLGILGTSDDGFGLDRRVDTGSADPLLVLDLTVVAGEVTVTEVQRG
ncbi:MAG: LiaF domain-containing protein [Acidimicrobiia bacterium]